MKVRVLYIVKHYPQISETYEHEEIASLWDQYEITIISIGRADLPRKSSFSHHFIESGNVKQQIFNIISQIRPHVIYDRKIRLGNFITL